MKIGMGLSLPLRIAVAGTDPDALAVIARMTTPPPAANYKAANDLVRSLKLAGVWSRLEALQIYAAHDAQSALLDWVRPGISATLHGSPTPVHHANKHFWSAGSPAYLNTKFNPSLATLFTQNDGAWGWYNGQGNLGSVYSGVFQGTTANRALFVHATPRLDISASDTADRASSTQSAYGRLYGLCAVSRTGANLVTNYVRGQAANSPNSASAARANGEMFGFANNIVGTGAVNFGANKLSAFFAGASLDATQMKALSDALDAYMAAVSPLPSRLAVWGDSLSAGGLPPYGNDWRHQVEQGGAAVQAARAYRWVFNGGVGGESAAQIRTRMIADTTYRDHAHLIWAGRNGYRNNVSGVLADIDAMVQAALARSGKFLVLSVTNGQPNNGVTSGLQGAASPSPAWEDKDSAPWADIVAINGGLLTAYGANYVDVRGPLVAAGTAPEIARDVPALSLLNTNDPIHINAAGAAIVAAQVNAKLDALGW